MDFLFGFMVGLGAVCALLPVAGAVWVWRWLTRPAEVLDEPIGAEPEEVEFFEDRAPEWMRVRKRPYDPTGGYVPKRRSGTPETTTGE